MYKNFFSWKLFLRFSLSRPEGLTEYSTPQDINTQTILQDYLVSINGTLIPETYLCGGTAAVCWNRKEKKIEKDYFVKISNAVGMTSSKYELCFTSLQGYMKELDFVNYSLWKAF